MEEPFLTYTLSFVHSKGRKPPELIITLKDEILSRADEILHTSRIVEISGLYEYLREDYADPWREPELALERSNSFGIRGCGYVLSKDGISQIHFRYSADAAYRIAMTLNVLFKALDWIAQDKVAPSNRHQLFSINTRCERRHEGWGHMMAGTIYPTFRRWLARLPLEQREHIEGDVGEAVLEAFLSFSAKGERKEQIRYWEYLCRAGIGEEGRFIIMCPGNACDIAIYPDSDSLDENYLYCSFSCHNLDRVDQQLCLLAGFARLIEHAQAGMENTEADA